MCYRVCVCEYVCMCVSMYMCVCEYVCVCVSTNVCEMGAYVCVYVIIHVNYININNYKAKY